MKWLIGLLLGASLLPAVAKELPPQGGTPKDFSLTQTETFVLDNGLKVTLVPYGKSPKVTLRLVSATGNYFDGDNLSLSDISYDLLTEGTSTMTAQQIAQTAASMGGSIERSVAMNSSFLQIDVLSEFAGDAAALMSQLVTDSVFAEEDLNLAVTNMWRGIQVQRTQAAGQANEAFFAALYPGHPYGRTLPTEAQMKAITAADAKAFIGQYVVASNSHLYVAGVFDAAAVKPAITEHFGKLAVGEASPPYQAPTEAQAPSMTFIQREGAPQSTLRLGLPVIDPKADDYTALQAMNSMLGGSFSSRITSNIREDKGYTYSPFSAVSANVGQATWYQGADVTAEATGPALFEIISEIKRLQDEAPSVEELQSIKNYMSGIFVLQNSSRTSIIGQLAYLERHGLGIERLQNYVKTVNAITPDDISQMAKTHLGLNNMTLVVVGDEASAKPQLAEVEALKRMYNL